jgi:EAL domain-containing protein (putative c-di-GMP-specific phosphodiesterase class I)
VARLGGDEFVVMLEGLSEYTLDAAAQSDRVSEKILSTLNQPYLLLGHDYHNTPSIGVTLFSGNEASADELLKRADLAMYEAKTSGRNAIRFFDPEMQASVAAQTLLEAELRDGIDHQQFVLYYQPQVDSHNEVMGYEALLRWQHPRRGLLLPSEFVPLAEDIGLIIPIGLWALEAACRQLARWAQHPHTAGWFVAVNISVRQLSHPSFIEQVLTVLRHTGAPTSRLTLEVTEGLLHANLDGAIAKMNALKAHGIGFSLDDFGTGFSSLVLLRRLPLDQLKIDKSFVHNMLTDANAAALACSVLSLGQSLGLAVIAEGVEAEAQRDFLLERGCRFFQGYLFGRPEPVREAF